MRAGAGITARTFFIPFRKSPLEFGLSKEQKRFLWLIFQDMRGKGNKKVGQRFVVCIDNSAYEASLELYKIYSVLPDPDADRDGDLRIIDESGEDYLFAAGRFIAIEVPEPLERAMLKPAS
jgi:hypothetical protein